MTAIAKAIAEIDSQDAEGQLSYRQVAKKYGVPVSTLTRRHHRQRQSREAAAKNHSLLTPPQEEHLVKHIQRLSAHALPPSRAMIKKYVAALAPWEPSDSWVTRFLRRHRDAITNKTSTGIDRDRCIADNREGYRNYFCLLYKKLDKYDIKPYNIYNMDEKGFLLGVCSRSKRVFSRPLWDKKKVSASIQDGNRNWITVIGCVCADGSWVDPVIIYQGKSGLRDSWLRDLEVGRHQLFCCSTPSGWSNNDIGLAWLEQVFDRKTKEKAKRDWRLLLLDGHGSHVTPSFIDYCDAHRILLAVLPPHSSHQLQPLDIAVFGPLATAYGKELDKFLHRSQALLEIQKSDFLELF